MCEIRCCSIWFYEANLMHNMIQNRLAQSVLISLFPLHALIREFTAQERHEHPSPHINRLMIPARGGSDMYGQSIQENKKRKEGRRVTSEKHDS